MKKRVCNRKPVVLLDLNGNFIKEYESQSELSRDKGIQQGLISQYLSGRVRSKKYKFMFKDDYDELFGLLKEDKKENVEDEYKEEYQDEITKKKTKEYFVNMLVGLANQTLRDGAVYELANGTRLVYNKENDSLEMNGFSVYTRNEMYQEVQVELPLLEEKEKEFLGQLFKAFTRIKGIRKCKSTRDGFEFIRVETGTDEDIVLPDFREGLYYNNLQQNRLYSVDELEIK